MCFLRFALQRGKYGIGCSWRWMTWPKRTCVTAFWRLGVTWKDGHWQSVEHFWEGRTYHNTVRTLLVSYWWVTPVSLQDTMWYAMLIRAELCCFAQVCAASCYFMLHCTGFNSGALNSGALNSGALNSGTLNSGVLNSGAHNSALPRYLRQQQVLAGRKFTLATRIQSLMKETPPLMV